MMKKMVAALLAASLALSPCAVHTVPVFGASGAGIAAQAQQTEGSVLDIRVASSPMYPYEGKVTAKVSNGSGISKEQELYFAADGMAQASFDVPAGAYTVVIKAKKFADYIQTVEAKSGWTHKILVNPVRTENGNNAQAGWLRAGDIDGDGDIDKDDSKALTDAIHANRTDSMYDLNGDGKVDLADLHTLVQGIDAAQESAVEMLCFPKSSQSSDNTLVEGAIGSFLQGKDSIVLKPKSGGTISEGNPVEFHLTMPGGEEGVLLGGLAIYTPSVTDANGNTYSQISKGDATITYLDASGKESIQTVSFGSNQTILAGDRNRNSLASATSGKENSATEKAGSLEQKSLASAAAGKASGMAADVEADGTIVIDFGGQIAVKRVTIRITGTTKKEQPLVEIAKVEFVNDMQERISEPKLDIPTILSLQPGDKSLAVAWSAQNNVTGYELSISGPVDKQNTVESQIIKVTGTQHQVGAINNKGLINYKEYTVKVRSVNGNWTSPWSPAKTATPVPQGKPAPPDNVRAQGGYRSVTVSWKNMSDATGYMVYYKESAASAFQPVVSGFVQQDAGVGRLTANSYTITGLKDYVSYSVYVVSWNESGWGNPSLTAQATTKSEALPLLPKYKLLNTSNGTGRLTSHILSAAYGGSGGASMKGSPLDTGKSALGLVDDDYASYWSKSDWDDGVAYTGPDKGMEILLDQDYKMNYFTYAAADQIAGCDQVRITYGNAQDKSAVKSVGARLLQKMDANDNPYYIVKLNETIIANRIHLYLGRSSGNRAEIKVGEVHFHSYDPIEDDIMALYTDEMHTVLRADVTEATIRALENRLQTADPVSGEKHPLYKELEIELQTARDILNSNLAPSYEVHNQITDKKDGHLGFGGLNAWQPLGRTAYAGESLLVFVGHNTKRTGDGTNLQLVYTQHHAEAANVSRAVNLKVGKNILTVPQLASTDVERGGQLYIAYNGNNPQDKYAVRIGGGSAVPALDLYGKEGAARTAAIREYIQTLENYVTTLETGHGKAHTGVKNVDYNYDKKNCILNATDILMEQMMYSLPATQVLAGLSGAQGVDAKVKKLDRALQAMDDMMALFYHHKGLSDSAGTTRGSNALPSRHLNIRYMRMFAGAFMYASGNHIGIEWGSAPLASSPDTMAGFGWGIAHEIGHNINQGSYAVAEITNNYFAQLLKKVGGGGTRFQYSDVYKKVTSGASGRASNVFVQLAMYWQLHLAFDNQADDAHIYTNYNEQFNNLFFARVDTYSRNPKQAPQDGLTLNGGPEQNLVRLACAAANANMLPFFERWGIEPDAETKAYAQKYGAPVQKAYYYVNDEARDYRVAHAAQEASAGVAGKDVIATPRLSTTGANGRTNSNRVTITIPLKDGVKKDAILGYEIIRSMISDGKMQPEEVVGFQEIDQNAAETVFVDTLSTVNNRVMYYKIRAVDKFLNYSNVLDAGSRKIETEGELDKANWSIETTMASDEDELLGTKEEEPDSGYDTDNNVQAKNSSITRIIDNKTDDGGTYHEAASSATSSATITIDMHKAQAVTALKYQGSALASLTVEVSEDGQKWTAVRKGYTGLDAKTAAQGSTVWFDAVQEGARDHWIGTYTARYVKLTFTKSGPASIQEIEICGPSGDNVKFYETGDGKPAVGLLSKAWTYGDKAEDVIAPGALVFTGKYKGNPDYNVVILYDQDGNVIGSYNNKVESVQVIMAKVPEHGNLGEVSDGTWVYCVEPAYFNSDTLKKITSVRAELYRVDDAKTLDGERIVSDTEPIEMPQTLPSIILEDYRPKSGQ